MIALRQKDMEIKGALNLKRDIYQRIELKIRVHWGLGTFPRLGDKGRQSWENVQQEALLLEVWQ
jgi:hypothetical protein